MFGVGLLLIITRINCVHTATGIVVRCVDYTNCCLVMHRVDYASRCLYRVDPPDNEQQACLKHVGAYY
jgi:hypothetical protein